MSFLLFVALLLFPELFSKFRMSPNELYVIFRDKATADLELQ